MNQLLKSVFFGLTLSCTNVFADDLNVMPELLCVDSQSYWDGEYTVEISPENSAGKVLARVYSQSPEKRVLVQTVNVSKKVEGTKVTYQGKDFNLELQMESVAAVKTHPAEINFKNEEENVLVSGSYVCLLY